MTTAPQEINTYTSKQTEAKVKAFANKKKKTLIGVAKGLAKGFINPVSGKKVSLDKWIFLMPLMQMWEKDKHAALTFQQLICHGNQPKNCPSSMVREILCQTGGKHGKHKSNYENAALIIGAMQKFLDGEKVNFHTKFNSVHFSK